MTIQGMDNVGIVVDDLEAAIASFLVLGIELEGKVLIEGPGARIIATSTCWSSSRRDKDIHRLCQIRGPEGLVVALAEELG